MDIFVILGIISFIVLVTMIKLELRRSRKMRTEHDHLIVLVEHYNWLYKIGLCETAECFNELNFKLGIYKTTLGM